MQAFCTIAEPWQTGIVPGESEHIATALCHALLGSVRVHASKVRFIPWHREREKIIRLSLSNYVPMFDKQIVDSSIQNHKSTDMSTLHILDLVPSVM
jgi:hypothetical protein